MQCSRSKAGPCSDRMWTSLLITSGRKPASSIGRVEAKPKPPMPWPMSKMMPRSRASPHLGPDLAADHGRVRERPVAVGQDVALAQARQHVLARRRREVDVGHHRQVELLGDLDREFEREHAVALAGVAADPDLDADDQVAVLLGDLEAFARIEQADVAAFADHHRLREGEDAGEGDVEIRQDADRRGLDDVGAKAVEVAGPGAAGIDQGGGARAQGHWLRLDAEAGAAPVDVGVQVDQPRHHEAAVGGHDLTRLAGIDRRLDGGDLAVLERHVPPLVAALGGIDHPPASDHQIVHQPSHPWRCLGLTNRRRRRQAADPRAAAGRTRARRRRCGNPATVGRYQLQRS